MSLTSHVRGIVLSCAVVAVSANCYESHVTPGDAGPPDDAWPDPCAIPARAFTGIFYIIDEPCGVVTYSTAWWIYQTDTHRCGAWGERGEPICPCPRPDCGPEDDPAHECRAYLEYGTRPVNFPIDYCLFSTREQCERTCRGR